MQPTVNAALTVTIFQRLISIRALKIKQLEQWVLGTCFAPGARTGAAC